MKRVALISPRGTERNQANHILNDIYRSLRGILTFIEVDDIEFMPNLGLLTVAAFLPRDWDVRYLEEDYIDLDAVEPILFDQPYDLVCLSAVNNQAHRAYAIADEFRRRNVTVVMGGLHATALPQEAAAHADAVCIGE